MHPESAFAPFRPRPGAPPAEAARLAAGTLAGPLLAGAHDAVDDSLRERALESFPAGPAPAAAEACLAADGSPAGHPGPPRSCLTSAELPRRAGEAARRALSRGLAGILLERPDASLALGLLGAGFCASCREAFHRALAAEYGEQLEPFDYPRLAREALAQAPGALHFEQLPFGRDYWRFRAEALSRAVGACARAARDAARSAGRLLEVAAELEALGPAQLAAARHLDAAAFPVSLRAGESGVGAFRLLRAVMGRRPCAVALAPATPPAEVATRAAAAAACGIEVCGAEPPAPADRELAAVRRFGRELASRDESPALAEPVAECALLYSSECDLWTQGRHREAVEIAGETLAALHVQAPVVLRPEDAPPQAALVLCGAEALSAAEAQAVARRVEAGDGVIAFGEPGAVDAAGRALGSFLPRAGPPPTGAGRRRSWRSTGSSRRAAGPPPLPRTGRRWSGPSRQSSAGAGGRRRSRPGRPSWRSPTVPAGRWRYTSRRSERRPPAGRRSSSDTGPPATPGAPASSRRTARTSASRSTRRATPSRPSSRPSAATRW